MEVTLLPKRYSNKVTFCALLLETRMIRILLWPLYLGERQRPGPKLHSLRVPCLESITVHPARFWVNWQVSWVSLFFLEHWYYPFIFLIDLSSCRWRRVFVVWVASKDKSTYLTFMGSSLGWVGWGPVLRSGILARDLIDLALFLDVLRS